VLRVASDDDLAEYRHLQADAREKLDFCGQIVSRHDLPMELVECEHLLGGERIIFYFMAEGRVDFRSLVKDLAHEYQTRIEMRQIGARDEARLLADYETCGQQCCCRVFLKSLKPVTMKMAKMQKATLDPSKVSGRCGRLKCCLRYEHSTYEELERRLPKTGERVETEHGSGVVVGRQVLTQLVQIETSDGGRVTLPMEVIEEARRNPPKPKPEPEAKPARPPRSPRSAGRERRPPKSEKRETRPAETQSPPSDADPAPKPGAGDAKKKRRRRGRRRRRRPNSGNGESTKGGGR
jgi:cell fate regulator YaaT (PSP1 superfamily)